MNLDEIAETYVRLAHKVDLHNPGYIDAYYGPEKLRISKRYKKKTFPLEKLSDEASLLLTELVGVEQSGENQQRIIFLRAQIESIHSYISILNGKKTSLEEEAQSVYQLNALQHDERYFLDIHKELEAKLGEIDQMFGLELKGSLGERLNAFYGLFSIPKGNLKSALKYGIEKSKKKTKQHVELPEIEKFKLRLVKGKSWKAYNWYFGGAKSRYDVNEDRDIPLLEAITLALHEGYPGHHTYNSLFDFLFAKKKDWVEFSIYPLFSPMSVNMEGMAKFAEKFVYSDDEKVEILMELANITGIDSLLASKGIYKERIPEIMKKYIELVQIQGKLEYGKVESARMFYAGEKEENILNWLKDIELLNEQDSKKRINFVKGYGAYITTYLSGLELVNSYIDRRITSEMPLETNPDKIREFTWKLYFELLHSSPTPKLLM